MVYELYLNKAVIKQVKNNARVTVVSQLFIVTLKFLINAIIQGKKINTGKEATNYYRKYLSTQNIQQIYTRINKKKSLLRRQL